MTSDLISASEAKENALIAKNDPIATLNAMITEASKNGYYNLYIYPNSELYSMLKIDIGKDTDGDILYKRLIKAGYKIHVSNFDPIYCGNIFRISW